MEQHNNNQTEQKAIFILGPTGIGKTYVSIHLALKFKGTIINTDAFSLYASSNIMTAKATKAEQDEVPHKMIDLLSLDNTSYTINQFTTEAITQIIEVYQSNRLPVIVGGTNYYLESLLFTKVNQSQTKQLDPFAIEYSPSNKLIVEIIRSKITGSSNKEDIDALYTEISEYLSTYSIQQLNELIKEIDDSYANFLHKNNTRRIISVIAYYFVYHRKKSDEVNAERKQLRYGNNSKVIVLSTTKQELFKTRIEGRVNDMIMAQGGLAEIYWVFSQFKSEKLSFTTGVLQAIGYKEFYPLYTQSIQDDNMNIIIEEVLDHYTEDKFYQHSISLYTYISSSNELLEVYNQCKDELIKNTIKYAKYQIKWIKKKILPLINGYHTIDIEEFSKEAYDEYISSAEAYIKSQNVYCQLNGPLGIEDAISNSKLTQWKKFHCDVCNSDMNGESERVNHYKSNTHKKRLAKYKKNNFNQNN